MGCSCGWQAELKKRIESGLRKRGGLRKEGLGLGEEATSFLML